MSDPQSFSRSLSERQSKAISFAAAALLCLNACFSIPQTNLHLLDSKPVIAPASPAAPRSSQSLKTWQLRGSVGASGAGFSPKDVEGTSTGQGNLNLRMGLPIEGLELSSGIGIPIFYPYGILQYQLLGLGADAGYFGNIEAGAAFRDDYFAGLGIGASLDRHWEGRVSTRFGMSQGYAYGEAGLGLQMHVARFFGMGAGTGVRIYLDETQPRVARAGVDLSFGSPLRSLTLEEMEAKRKEYEIRRVENAEARKLSSERRRLKLARRRARQRLVEEEAGLITPLPDKAGAAPQPEAIYTPDPKQ